MKQKIDMTVMIDGLKELASREKQEELWKKGIEGEIHSLDEAICYVFDDSGVNIAFEKGRIDEIFPKDLQQKILLLKNDLNVIQRVNLSPEEIIGHKNMESVRKTATEILQAIEE